MAAGLGFKTFTTGEVLTAGDVNGYLMQGINVFASSAARASAITSPQEGQYSFLKDTNALEYYDGAAWVGAPVGDITAVTAGTGISGGGSSGDVTITNSMATTITTKGDLVPGTGSATFARLAAGANDTVLTADSSTATGLKWAAAASSGSTNVAGKNGVLNSNFSIWQRGTSFTATGGYIADRWYATLGNTGRTVTRQTTSDTTNLPFIQYCVRMARDSGITTLQALKLAQSFETVNSIPFAGKTVTLSFYARAGANYSAASNALIVNLLTGTGTDQNYLVSGYTGSAQPINNQTATLTTTWQRFSFSGTVASTATELTALYEFNPTGTAGANDYFEVTGVQVEIASSASAYSPNAATQQAELAACQRYYYQIGPGSAYASFGVGGFHDSTTAFMFIINTPVVMRTVPTFTTLGSFQTNGTGITLTGLGFNTTYSNVASYNGQASCSGATTGYGSSIRNINDTTAKMMFNSEL